MNLETTETVVEHQVDQYVLDGGSLPHKAKQFQNLPYKKLSRTIVILYLKNMVVL